MVHHDFTPAGLRALLQDILEDAPAAKNECDVMRRNLDLYVHDELEGRDARSSQPDLWAHLQGCAECRQQYDLLLTLLTAEARGELLPLPPRPAAVGVAEASPWRLLLDPEVGQRPSLLFVFRPAYLRDSLRRGRTADGWRGAPGQPAAETLLLSYLGETPAGEAMVQMYARPLAAEPAQCLLTLIAVAEPMPRTAVLTWGDRTLETASDSDGSGQFGPAPLAALDDAAPGAFSLRLVS